MANRGGAVVMVGTAMIQEEEEARHRDGERKHGQKEGMWSGGNAQGSKKDVLQWPGGCEVPWEGEGRRRHRGGLEVLQTRRVWSQIPIAGIFNWPLSCLSCRYWLQKIIIVV